MPSNKKEKKKVLKSKYKKWTQQEHFRYAYSLIILASELQQDKKRTHLFQQLSQYTNKTSTQNRTHHVKMVEQYKNEQCPQRQFLYNFYYQAFIIRHLDEEQLKKELKIFINSLDISQESKSEKMRSALQNLQKLELEKNGRACKIKERSQLEQNQQNLMSTSSSESQVFQSSQESREIKQDSLRSHRIQEQSERTVLYQKEIVSGLLYDQVIPPSKQYIQEQRQEFAHRGQAPKFKLKIGHIPQYFLYQLSLSEQQYCFEEQIS